LSDFPALLEPMWSDLGNRFGDFAPRHTDVLTPRYEIEEISKTWLDAVMLDDVSDVKSIPNLLFNVG